MLNEEPKEWKDLLKFADFFLKSGSISSDKWTLGGGTALMLYYKHRLSKDIDIFFNNAQFITLLTPRLNDTVERYVNENLEILAFCSRLPLLIYTFCKITNYAHIEYRSNDQKCN